MESPNLDETSPTYKTPEGQSVSPNDDPMTHANPASDQEAGIGATQPMTTKSVENTAEGEPIAPSTESSQPDSSGGQSIGATQISRLADDGIYPPTEIPDQPPDAPKRRGVWVLWAFLAVLVLALIAGGSAFAGYNSAINQRTRYESTLVAGGAANHNVLAQQDIVLCTY